MNESRQKLFTYREKRVHPFKDDKVLTAWNGLMITALARGAALLGDVSYCEEAKRAVQFIQNKLIRQDGRLLARYRDGESAFNAYLDDYSFLIWGLIELYKATFEPIYFKKAIDLTDKVRELFLDQDGGGFFYNGFDAEQLIARPKEIYDGAIPSGNSVMTLNLLHLAAFTGDSELEELSTRQINSFSDIVAEHPMGYSYFMTALLFAIDSTTEVAIVGKRNDSKVMDMLRIFQQKYKPNTVLVFKPEDEELSQIEKLIPFIKEKKTVNGQAAAYICRERVCQEPVTELETLSDLLQ